MASSANPCCSSEIEASSLSFPGILNDPMVRDLMKADHVDSAELGSELKKIAEIVGGGSRTIGRDPRSIRWQRDRVFRRSLP